MARIRVRGRRELPRQLAYRAGRAAGRGRALGRVWEQDRSLAIQIGLEDLRAQNRLQQLGERLKVQHRALQERTEEERARTMRNRLSEELGIRAGMAGRSLEDLGELGRDPHTILAHSQTTREMTTERARVTEREAGGLFRTLPQGARAFLVANRVDVRDPAAVSAGVQGYFREQEAEAARKTDAEIDELATAEFRWIFTQLRGGRRGASLFGGAGQDGAPAQQLIGSDPELQDALDEEGVVDWTKLRTLVRQKWQRKKAGQVTAPAPEEEVPEEGTAEEWASEALERLGIGGP